MSDLELNAELRILVDSRLEEIERVLLRVPMTFSERRHILAEVEAQVFELLSRRGEPIDRELVQAVLASLDPAEAYIPEELRGKLDEPAAKLPPSLPAGPRFSRLAMACGVLTTSSFVIWAILTFHAMDSHSQRTMLDHQRTHNLQFALIITMIDTTVLGLIAIVRILLSSTKLRGLILAVLAAMIFPISFGNSAMLAMAFMRGSIVPTVLTIIAILVVNFFVLRALYLWTQKNQPRLSEFVRGCLTGRRTKLSGSM